MSGLFSRRMTTADLLAITGRLAPVLRGKKPRALKVINDAGKVVGIIDDAKVAERLLERAGIEVSLSQEAEKAYSETHCVDCGCERPRSKRNKTGCCKKCAVRRMTASLSPEQRTQKALKRAQTMGASGRSRTAKGVYERAGWTSEQRSILSKNRWAGLTAAQRTEHAQKIWAARRRNGSG